MIGTCREIELAHCCPHQALTFGLQLTKLPDLADAHVCITCDIRCFDIRVTNARVSLCLNISCGLNPLANRLAGFTQPVAAELFVIHTRDFDVNIDAVEQETGDSLLVIGNNSGGTGAGLLRVAVIAAGTGGVHNGYKFTIGRI